MTIVPPSAVKLLLTCVLFCLAGTSTAVAQQTDKSPAKAKKEEPLQSACEAAGGKHHQTPVICRARSATPKC